jgi:hypothetical protein
MPGREPSLFQSMQGPSHLSNGRTEFAYRRLDAGGIYWMKPIFETGQNRKNALP